MAVNGFTYRSRASHLKRFSFGTQTPNRRRRYYMPCSSCGGQSRRARDRLLAPPFVDRSAKLASRSNAEKDFRRRSGSRRASEKHFPFGSRSAPSSRAKGEHRRSECLGRSPLSARGHPVYALGDKWPRTAIPRTAENADTSNCTSRLPPDRLTRCLPQPMLGANK
jgi:hypothetical protein